MISDFVIFGKNGLTKKVIDFGFRNIYPFYEAIGDGNIFVAKGLRNVWILIGVDFNSEKKKINLKEAKNLLTELIKYQEQLKKNE